MAFLAAGMIVFWITTFIFVFSIMRRERRLEEEVAMLREVVAEEEAS
jgi:hypothetical protein